MRYRILGRSGLRVSELCLGTMTFGEDWGWGASQEDSRQVFDAFVQAGGNFIDTASNYTNGTSERYVGELIAADRDYFVIATKYTLRRKPQIEDNLGVLDFALEVEHLARLSAVNPPPVVYPHSFWNEFVRRDLIFGERLPDLEEGLPR